MVAAHIPSAADALLAELDRLPDWLEALTPLGREKNAYLKDWGSRPQTKDQIRAEIRAGRCHAVGLICGPASGLMVLDHDGVSADGPLQTLMGGEALPPTWRNGSGRPGRWAAVFRIPEQFWPRLKGKEVRETGALAPDNGKAEALELRWTGHQSALIGAHPMHGCGYSWFQGRSPADLPEPAIAPQPLIKALLEKQQDAEPLPLLKALPPAAAGLRLPLLEFVSRETREFVKAGGTPGRWNDDQLTHALDLIGAEQWIQQQGHTAEPTAREAFAQHIAAAVAKDRSFDKRKAWGRFDGGLKRNPSPSTPEVKLRDRLAFQLRQAARPGPQDSTSRRQKAAEGGAAADGAQQAEGHARRLMTAEEKLADLLALAGKLQADRTGFAERLPILRHRAAEIDLPIRDQELAGFLTAARRQRLGADGLLETGAIIDLSPEPWVCEGLILRGCLNLVIAMPKQGKTSFVVSLVANWSLGVGSFLDRQLHGPCPPVLIVGTDQGQADWGRMLQAAGLVDRSGRILEPIVALAHAGAPLHLTPEGIDRIADYAQRNPGLLVVIDSLSACIAPLGLKEESPEVAMPVAELMEQLEPHGVTVVLIHHAGKGRAGEGASSASRGSTALPALASQLLKLAPANPNDPRDSRRMLTTEGRGGSPLGLVIERVGPSWIAHGSLETLQREQEKAEAIRKLNDRQADALALLRERWADGFQRTTSAEVVEGIGIKGKDPATTALRVLKQLQHKGLAQFTRQPDQFGGRGAFAFWPTSDGSEAPSRGAHDNTIGSVASVGSPSREDPNCAANVSSDPTSDTSGTSDASDASPARERREPPVVRIT